MSADRMYEHVQYIKLPSYMGLAMRIPKALSMAVYGRNARGRA
jgi:hypothetical protein